MARTILGLALVAQGDKGIEVNLDSLRPLTSSSRAAALAGLSFGDDYGDDDFGDDDVGDDDFGDDVGDDVGDDYGDDVGDDVADDVGDDVGAERRTRHRQGSHGKKQRRHKRKMFGNLQTFLGTPQGSSGVAVSATFTPTATLRIDKVVATGDTAAVITTIMAGQRVIFAGNLSATVLGTGSYNVPLFENKWLKSGEPVTINYTSGGTSGLQLTFLGKTPGRRVRC